MQKLHRPRNDFRAAAAYGFSLIELMVTLVVVVVLASVAVVGMRGNELEGQRRRFVADIQGALTQARNRAIDDQTPVRVDLNATSMTLTALDPVSETWDLFERVAMTHKDSQLLLDNNTVCIYGLGAGVQPPSQAQAVTVPTGCLGGDQRLQFEPDGTFSDPNNEFSDVPNAGVTLWIGDSSVAGQTTFSIIQVFPGGLIRTFEQVS